MSRSQSEPSRNGASVEALVAEHEAALLRYAGRLIRNEDSAQDIVQETFVRYLKNGPRAQEHPRQRVNWLFRVAHNLSIDLIRKERRMRESTEQMDPPEPVASAAEIVEAEQTRERLGGLLERLTENQRAVIVLKFQEKKTYREIAAITGLSISNVGFLIHRGLKRLGAFARKEEMI